ncbi:unnamed protein product [Allacma fusca]|uniref:Uncharacterized protein n=1 Tax=Allacma fusca TaxID=39272 RepID=A0A8J2K2F9_9HEXA|nr:unnamed protein product [Allacma fusca]
MVGVGWIHLTPASIWTEVLHMSLVPQLVNLRHVSLRVMMPFLTFIGAFGAPEHSKPILCVYVDHTITSMTQNGVTLPTFTDCPQWPFSSPLHRWSLPIGSKSPSTAAATAC